jgi:hypothetical protein
MMVEMWRKSPMLSKPRRMSMRKGNEVSNTFVVFPAEYYSCFKALCIRRLGVKMESWIIATSQK